MLSKLKEFLFANGVSGNEKNIREVLAKNISPYVDKVYTDPMGNLIAFKKGSTKNAKKLMFAAHMDEIGFMVTYIEDSGYIRVSRMGGINFAAVAFCLAEFENGTLGAIVPDGSASPATYSQDNFYIDIGVRSKKEAEKKVKIGDFCRLRPQLEKLSGSFVCGRPIDDRIGCYMIYEAAKRTVDCKNDTYFVFTVQEEVGVRGAKTSAFSVAPDYAIALDIGGTGDTIKCRQMAIKLGDGIAIKLKDGMVICHKTMVDLMIESAKKRNAKYQLEILESGGTDTCMLQQAAAGSIAGALSIPTRYGHSGVETINMKDVESGIEIMTEICETTLK